jgi:hypothetical protein
MTYSESTFLLVTLLFLYAMARRWPLFGVALLAGLATAVRPVGVALTGAFAWYILSDASRGPKLNRSFLTLLLLPVACWGLITFMIYQGLTFDNPIAFAQTQKYWHRNPLPDDTWDKVESLMSGEPIWAPYSGDPYWTWNRINREENILFNLTFWNPIFFLSAILLIIFGAYKSWLIGPESALGLGLLAIPYFTKAYDNQMVSHARFASVVVPAYLVVGRLLYAMPPWLAWGLLVVSGSILTCWSALFAAGYRSFI